MSRGRLVDHLDPLNLEDEASICLNQIKPSVSTLSNSARLTNTVAMARVIHSASLSGGHNDV
ncbi:hypothetical protein E2C01_029889 [Portunus trituberculatus]|uniref:Uncharacterized protein n=1 Tax=Portunus trituberculatus TaxID=210409 RepID=A0A5B7EPH9_PORTR|nr:hypothetical protein [Portunus trituberculatus]